MRTVLFLLTVTMAYFAVLYADGRWWLLLPLIIVVAAVYGLLDQPLRDMRGRGR